MSNIENEICYIGYFPSNNVKEIVSKAKQIKITDELKNLIIETVKNGEVYRSYRGFSTCRICRKMLGSQDLKYKEFVFPYGWEHYIVEHDILPVFNYNTITTKFIDNLKLELNNESKNK